MNLSPFTIALIGVVGLLGVGFYGLLGQPQLDQGCGLPADPGETALLALVAAGRFPGTLTWARAWP